MWYDYAHFGLIKKHRRSSLSVKSAQNLAEWCWFCQIETGQLWIVWDDSAKRVLHNIPLSEAVVWSQDFSRNRPRWFQALFQPLQPPEGFFSSSPARIEHDVSAQRGGGWWYGPQDCSLGGFKLQCMESLTGKLDFCLKKNWGGHGCAPSHGTFHLGYWW